MVWIEAIIEISFGNLVAINLIFQAFLHISTLYSNCDRKMIEEKVYESDIAYEKIIQVSMSFCFTTLHYTLHYIRSQSQLSCVCVCVYENCQRL